MLLCIASCSVHKKVNTGLLSSVAGNQRRVESVAIVLASVSTSARCCVHRQCCGEMQYSRTGC